MNQNSKQLLLELLLLKTKYEAQTFETVSKVLKEKENVFMCEVLSSLKKVDEIEAVQPPRENVKEQDSAKVMLSSLKDQSPRKYELLNEILPMLRSKQVFRVKKQLQDYVGQRVHLKKKTNTIDHLINTYIEEISQRSEDELAEELNYLNEMSNSKQDVSTFLNMAKEIVNSRQVKQY